jgi:hypothetical protein
MAGAQGIICLFRTKGASWRAYMTDSNLNIWGELCVPVGLLICFGVALVVWLREEIRAGSKDSQREP